MSKKKEIVFGNKSIEDLYEEIYDNVIEKKEELQKTLNSILPLVKDSVQSATILLPEIVKLQNSGIMNNDALIKLALAINKSKQGKVNTNTDNIGITQEEIEELLRNASASEATPHGSK